MMTTIRCPLCGTPIPVETDALIKGVGFQCPKCQSVISLCSNSAPVFKGAMETLERLKRDGGYKD
jgi:phage FluMu protein Com